MSDNRERLLAAILACDPCQDETWLREGAEHWPKDVTLSWLLRNPERGARVVTVAKRRWLGLALLRQHAPARLAAALQVVANRARARITETSSRAVLVYLAKVEESARLASRGGQMQAASETLAAAVRTARAARADCAEEALQQVEDLAVAADGFEA